MIEELGELAHHQLKLDQGIRGSALFHATESKDAIGDMVIYLLGVFSVEERKAHLLAWAPVEPPRTPQDTILHLARTIGRLTTSTRPGVQAARVMWLCKHYCGLRGWDFDTVVQDTWNVVKERDWIADPQAGGESPLPPLPE